MGAPHRERRSPAEGNIAATVIGPDQTGGYRVLQHFHDQAALESWLSSSQRAELLREAKPLLERPPAVRRTGLETWFHLPSDGPAIVPPPRWKMWLHPWTPSTPSYSPSWHG